MKISKLTLPNGLRLVLASRPESLSATVMIMVAAGSDYEDQGVNGISHFLEHMCFKGTKLRPGPSDIATELDALGARYNAFTNNEYTGYYATVESHRLTGALEVVADIYLNSQFNESELNKERGVIIEEINMYEDMPARQVHDHLATLLYGNQPAGRPITGSKETVKAITRPDLVKYGRRHYVPAATTVVVAGRFSNSEVKNLISRYFGSLARRPAGKKRKVVERQTRPAFSLKTKEADQAHLAFGFRSKHLTHRDAPVLAVLAAVLGGGMSSRLFKRIRDDLGAAYYVWADNDFYTDRGLFTIAVGADTKRTKLIIRAVLEECRRLKEESVLPAELKRVKDYLTGNLALELESNAAWANFLAIQLTLKGRWETPQERIRHLRRVTTDDLRRLAGEIFQNRRLNLAMVAPFTDQREFVGSLTV